jgi:hypothetical protein
VHPFIHEHTAVTDSARYTLALQYWLFYPFNDASNNHEGDWEHITVLVTTRAASDESDVGLLTAGDIDHILNADDAVLDSLVIRAVEYYFHHRVVVLDYLKAIHGAPRGRWNALSHLHIWDAPDFIQNTIRQRLAAYNGALATHAIGFISGNNKGPDELTTVWPRFNASYNRNGHGTYPFSGTWQSIGPLGATEQMVGRVVPTLRRGITTLSPSQSLKGVFADDHFMAYDEEDLTLVPDWERVATLVLESPAVRRQWSWLLLPIHWGFPAAESPGAGAMAHVDMGQVAASGPAFLPTWNRLSADSRRELYSPQVFRALLVPLTPWDRLVNGWGFLNIPVALIGMTPGYSVVVAHVAPWLTVPLEVMSIPPPKTFAPTQHPQRVTSVGVGWSQQTGGERFARMLPQPAELAEASAFAVTSQVQGDEQSLERNNVSGARVWLNLHYGPHLSVQNTYTRTEATLRYGLVDSIPESVGSVRGSMHMGEITGGFRYRVLSVFNDAVQLYGGGGWGWTWYKVNGVELNGLAMPFERKGGYSLTALPSTRWWPNTWYASIGVELLSPRTAWISNRIGYGLQLEYSALNHRLGAVRPGNSAYGRVGRRALSVAVVLSW